MFAVATVVGDGAMSWAALEAALPPRGLLCENPVPGSVFRKAMAYRCYGVCKWFCDCEPPQHHRAFHRCGALHRSRCGAPFTLQQNMIVEPAQWPCCARCS